MVFLHAASTHRGLLAFLAMVRWYPESRSRFARRPDVEYPEVFAWVSKANNHKHHIFILEGH